MCVVKLHKRTVVIRNAHILPDINLRNAPGIGIAPTNVLIHETNNAPECSEIAPGKPGVIPEHSGAYIVSCIGTFMGAHPITRAFLQSTFGQTICIPSGHSLSVDSATQL